MSLTLADAPRMSPDLRMRSRQFLAFPGISRGDVPPMCPARCPSVGRTLVGGTVSTMATANLGDMLKALDGELVNALKKSRASFGHAGTQGSDAESAVRIMLDSNLPRYLTVGTGEVIDLSDSRSGQLDIVIANEDQPFRTGLHDPGVFLMEGISAAGEVKSRLTTKNLDEAIGNASRFKMLRSNDEGSILQSSYGSDDRRFRRSRPYFLFAFESAVSTETLLARIRAARPIQATGGGGDWLDPLDAVFILGKGTAINYGDGEGAFQFTDEHEDVVSDWHWHATNDSVIIYFLLWLGSVMPRFMKMSPIASEYLFLLVNSWGRELYQHSPK